MKTEAGIGQASGNEPIRSGARSVRNAIADACFRFRAISVLPFLLLILIFFVPLDLGSLNPVLNAAGLLLALAGALTRIISVGHAQPHTSGRENYLRADSLNVSGLYSIVRNPLYVGNFLIYNGVLLAYSSPAALLFFNAFFISNYYFIILAEERYLERQFGPVYRDYRLRVPRVIPRFRQYRRNVHPFSPARAAYKEKNTTLYWVCFYAVALLLKQFRLNDGAVEGFWWHALPVVALFVLNIALTLSRRPKPA